MSQDQPFIWKRSSGKPVSWVVQSLDISKVSQIVLSRLVESEMWHQLAGSVGGGFREGTMASTCLDARHFSVSLYGAGTFQTTPALELSV